MSEWKTIYYSNKRGEKVVMDEILSFGSKNAAGIFHTIDLLNEYGVGLTGRHVKHIEDKLWELRIDRYRVLYLAFTKKTFVVLRCFLKKTNKTPRKEINLAKRRLGDFLGRSGDGYEKNN
jgi:phage-related protein